MRRRSRKIGKNRENGRGILRKDEEEEEERKDNKIAMENEI